MLFALMTFLCWGTADLFYKIGNKKAGNYNHLKTGICVGLIMGIHATIYMLVKKIDFNILEIIRYLPVSLLYIISMIIGYKGLKYLELSIVSPIQNCSGVITAILLLLFFKEALQVPAYIAFLLILLGVILLGVIEAKEEKDNRVTLKNSLMKKKVVLLTIFFPIAYCILDGLGTFLDAIYLDKMKLINEDNALIAYEYTFLIYSIITYIYLKKKRAKLTIKSEKPKVIAAIFETIGQFFYVYAMSANSIITAPVVGSYCILSLLWSRIFLKEKLSKKHYLAISLVVIGIIILGILDI